MCLIKLFAVTCALLVLTAVPGATAAPSLNERKEIIRSMDAKVSREAIQRKLRSETVLHGEGVPINRSLPVIESETDTKRRSKEEVAFGRWHCWSWQSRVRALNSILSKNS